MGSRDRPDGGGRIETYGGHGLWVPNGLTAAEIVEGGQMIADRFEINKHTARSIVIALLTETRRGAFRAGLEGCSAVDADT